LYLIPTFCESQPLRNEQTCAQGGGNLMNF
jgi:hypothetical protein